MKKFILLSMMALICHSMAFAQTLSNDVDIKKLNAQANTLAKTFCDCIVTVGTSSNYNGVNESDKKQLINEIEKDFYNYREDPRIMITTNSKGKTNRKPIYTYLNNLLAQSNTKNLRYRKYEIRCNYFYLNGSIKDWIFVKTLSDGCELYCKEITFVQTYRVIDILNKNPELRNTEHVEVDEKTMQVFAIKRPGTKGIVVRLGDVFRSECKDGRNKL